MNKNMETKPTTVFISHNQADKDTAREIALSLITEGINIWFDEWKISAGDSIVQEINTGLRGCTHFIIIWSVNASKSNWVRRELQSTLAKAIDTGSPRVIPILLDMTPLPELLSDILCIAFEGTIKENQQKIVKAVLGHEATSKLVEAIWKNYHEEIIGECLKDPLGVAFCPKCGDTNMVIKYFIEHSNYAMHLSIKCKQCNWSQLIYFP